jgi:hypothetical protein
MVRAGFIKRSPLPVRSGPRIGITIVLGEHLCSRAEALRRAPGECLSLRHEP